MKSKIINIIMFVLVLFLLINFASGELFLRINSKFNSYNEDFVAQTASAATRGYDRGYDAEAPSNPNPGDSCVLYDMSADATKRLVISTWNRSFNPDYTILKYACTTTTEINASLNLSWSFNDDNFNAMLYACTDSSCNTLTQDTNMKTTSQLKKNVVITAAYPTYFKMVITNATGTQTDDTSDTSSGAGGGGGGAQTNSPLKIIVSGQIPVYETGITKVPFTILNDGLEVINGVRLTFSLKKDSVPAPEIRSYFSQDFITLLNAREEKELNLNVEIKDLEPAIYEVTINAISNVPTYTAEKTIFLTLLGSNASGVMKLIVFTDGMINDNAECYELRAMLEEARQDLANGNLESALLKTQEALDLCTKATEGKKKPRIFERDDSKLLLYLLIAFAFAIILGIIFNLYRLLRFRKVFKNNRFDIHMNHKGGLKGFN